MPVEDLARQLGAKLSRDPFDGETSGMLYRAGGDIVIGINGRQSKQRQRFTIAHELGHLLLHRGRPMIIDKHVRINWRDETSSLATDQEEIQANWFAAELLMPRAAVQSELEQLVPQYGTRDVRKLVRVMATRFDVSEQAMSIRLSNLGIAWPLDYQPRAAALSDLTPA